MKFNNKRILLLLVVVSMLSLAACSSVPEDVESASVSDVSNQDVDFSSVIWDEVNTETSTFEFEGFAPGKSHVGTFGSWSGDLGFEGDKIVAARGTIDASSVNTGIDGLDKHLRSDDFFDVENYPEISIQSTNIDYENNVLYADLTFHGVTKSISFPVEIVETGLKADFLLDTTPFNIKYVAINKDVRLAFELVI